MIVVMSFGLTNCTKEKIDTPTVKVYDGAITLSFTSAGVTAEVTNQGGAEVKSRGFTYGLSGGMMDTVFCGSGTGVYSAELSNLEPNTTYVYEAFAKNVGGFGTSGKVSFTTKPLPTYTIDVSANPGNGGLVTGSGTFQEGQSCTVNAIAQTGFNFVKWTESEIQVSTDREYCFEVRANRNLVAHFTSLTYMITATVAPDGSGTVSGCDGYNYGDHCTLTATPNPGYTFDKWTENGNLVSTNREYTFEVTSSRIFIAHFTLQSYTVTATAEPVGYGTVSVSGGGVFHYNDQCTLTATPNIGYSFVNWTKNGSQVSTDATWHFSVTESGTYVAHFQITPFELALSANPDVIAQGGSSRLTAEASGGLGSYSYRWAPTASLNNANIQNPTATPTTTTIYTCTVTSGSQTASKSCTVKVVCPPANLTPTVQNNNSVRLTWTAADPATSYKVYRGNTLIAQNITATNYSDANLNSGTYTYQVSTVYNGVESPKSNSVQATIAPQAPVGAINGLFSVSATQKVWFSQGNLQYKASNGTWRFASNQYDYIGNANSQISSYYSGWIDLFGWGTSGWNCGNTYYRPWNSNNSNGSLYGPYGQNSLTGSYANSDWGYYNSISNGGNTTHQWRALTLSEWNYVFNKRSTTSGIRYAKAKVNNVNGVILLPDDWNANYYSLNSTNQSSASFSSNVISSLIWINSLEAHGAVFLPAAGDRYGTLVYDVGSKGYYWSASSGGTNNNIACRIGFSDDSLETNSAYQRYNGQSVRLVRPAN